MRDVTGSQMSWIWPVAGFLMGSIPFSYLAGRLLGGKDVRREGSGNVGATNVFRVAGRRAGIAAAAGDVLKSLLPVLAGRLAGIPAPLLAVTAAGVILGHCYSPFLRFRGGKGVISTVSATLVLYPAAAAAFGVVWLAVFLTGGYVSLASILASGALAVATGLSGVPALAWFGAAVFIFVTWKHRANVRRLLDGTESRMRGGGPRP
jgi:glycerol-3-phosphate acyltransferase PlsY